MDGLDWWAGVAWWTGWVDVLVWTGRLVVWWIGCMAGGLVEWKLAAWSSAVLQVCSSTRDRDGSAEINHNKKDIKNDQGHHNA